MFNPCIFFLTLLYVWRLTGEEDLVVAVAIWRLG
jgi:hypothetical protein